MKVKILYIRMLLNKSLRKHYPVNIILLEDFSVYPCFHSLELCPVSYQAGKKSEPYRGNKKDTERSHFNPLRFRNASNEGSLPLKFI